MDKSAEYEHIVVRITKAQLERLIKELNRTGIATIEVDDSLTVTIRMR